MLDFFNAVIAIFKSWVDLLFRLPFYGSISYGHMLLGIYFIALVFFILYARIK